MKIFLFLIATCPLEKRTINDIVLCSTALKADESSSSIEAYESTELCKVMKALLRFQSLMAKLKSYKRSKRK